MYKRIENQSFLALLILVSLAFFWVLKPFFGPIFWSVAIAIIFAPVQDWLNSKMPGRRNLNAALTLLACSVIVIIPVIFTITSVVGQIADFYKTVESGQVEITKHVQKVQDGFPAVQHWMDRFGIDFDRLKQSATEAAMAAGKFIAQHSVSIGQNAFGFALAVGVMLYVSFFFIRDGDKIVALLYKALPLGDEREHLLFTKFAEVTRATVKGNIVVAVVQGSIGGIAFAALGIGGAFLWGVVMAIFSLLPAVGASLIWAPVAIYLFATGSVIKGIILVIVGAVGIGLIDNILRPILVGRDTRLPDYLVLLSTLGGLVLFGINGFVIGPLIAALFIAFWGIFIREFQNENQIVKPEKPKV
ncbi:AI-2E family transporter [Saccharophagus sp. K07]|uniref:AI-2E family transporter n=1 Tax=Saccharophagus sp. K07 TaxID=2283636 RepID=UPI0016522C90|nr:AI-2E family transporter [Saccharophagus sp. K07]MBC6905893.1 AI-2E family transporter [Saccharophagus sp. K07]